MSLCSSSHCRCCLTADRRRLEDFAESAHDAAATLPFYEDVAPAHSTARASGSVLFGAAKPIAALGKVSKSVPTPGAEYQSAAAGQVEHTAATMSQPSAATVPDKAATAQAADTQLQAAALMQGAGDASAFECTSAAAVKSKDWRALLKAKRSRQAADAKPLSIQHLDRTTAQSAKKMPAADAQPHNPLDNATEVDTIMGLLLGDGT